MSDEVVSKIAPERPAYREGSPETVPCRVCGAYGCYYHSQACPRCGEDHRPCQCDREEEACAGTTLTALTDLAGARYEELLERM